MIFGTGIRSLCLTLSAVCLTLLAVPAYASQSPEAVQRAASEEPSVTPVPEVQLTTEQRVDRIFGVVVEQMVKVLFWDVAFWDNNAPLTVSEPFAERYPLLLADPLGWELAAFGESGGQSFSKSLEPKVEYAFEGRATVGTYTADGLTLYVGTDRGEIVHFSREGGQGKSLYQGKGAITRIVLHPNGTGIWAGDAGGQLVEIPSTDSEPAVLATFKGEIRSLEFRNGGGYALASSADGETRVFSTEESGAWNHTATLRGGGAILHAEFSGEGAASILTVSEDGKVILQGSGGTGEWGFGEPLTRVWNVDGNLIGQAAASGALKVLALQEQATASPLTLARPERLAGLSVPGAFYALDAKGNLKKVTAGAEGWQVSASIAKRAKRVHSVRLSWTLRCGVYTQRKAKLALVDQRVSLPFVVFWLAFGAVFFTLEWAS